MTLTRFNARLEMHTQPLFEKVYWMATFSHFREVTKSWSSNLDRLNNNVKYQSSLTLNSDLFMTQQQQQTTRAYQQQHRNPVKSRCFHSDLFTVCAIVLYQLPACLAGGTFIASLAINYEVSF